MKAAQIIKNLQKYSGFLVDKIGTNVPMLKFCKPLVVRAIDNNICKLESGLKLLADTSGEIDINGIVLDMEHNIINMEPFTLKTDIIGNVILGGGKIQFDLPIIDKEVILTQEDIDMLKEIILSK
jgi:hypothetical protein